ncbi:MAG: type I-E CRISPR-associated protein Cas7/Cse4/CasC [Candidatus Contendobacter sp.]|nr:type I-E CRISPR-associated protein Cas7/Cse4/CasC [Candidatus Contendobacter sp.]MDG4556686.1 type I-E CRISPR-associated protein Cas7/Cse4/CasC [Candidatus Contendobacter sp.]
MNINKNFLNFHVLMSHSPSCLNRDDMNMQKTAMFGGKNRVRISSQSLKRAIRKSAYYKTHFGQPSTRTRELEILIPRFVEALRDEFDQDLIAKTMELFVRAKVEDDQVEETEDQEEDSSGNERKKLAVAPWALEEIRALCNIVKDVALTDEEMNKAREKAAKQKGKKKKSEQELIDDALTAKRVKAVDNNIRLIRQAMNSALDVALSGRMATSGLMTSIDGALAVAHVLTTHAVEPQDVDWFTAVDDLKEDTGEVGAGHLDTQQFSAGVFYRYASLNLKQLQVNLGLIPDMDSDETSESHQRALDIARHVLHLLATIVPSAKQQSFAAHNLADFALVSFSDIPISLANAFEKPITQARGGGYIEPSIQALANYWETLNTFHNLEENAVAASSRSFNCPARLKLAQSLPEIEVWIINGGQD